MSRPVHYLDEAGDVITDFFMSMSAVSFKT